MAKVRRVIQKIERTEGVGFDDQLWPINLALLVLTGFVAGIIIAAGGFDDPRLLYNGWFRLATLAVTVGGLFWAALRVNRRIARRMQFAILLSLILHIGLALMVKDRLLELIAQSEPVPQENVPEQEQPKAVEYVMQPPDQVPEQQTFEKPVETETPQPDPEPQPVEREQTTPREVQPQEQPVTLPEPEPTIKPTPVKLQRPQAAAPRRAEEMSKLSRQVELAQNQPAKPITTPTEQPKAVEQPAKKLDASQAEVAKSQNRLDTPKQTSTEAPSTVVQQQQVQVAARATRPERTPQASATPTLQKQVAAAAAVPRAEAVRPEMAKPTQPTEAKQPAPRAEIVQRTQSASPMTAKQADAPTLEAPTPQATAEAARRQPSESRPTLAQAERPTPSKRPAETQLTPDAVSTPENSLAQPLAPQTAPGPQATAVAKRAAETPRESAALSPSPETSRSQTVGPVAATTSPRAISSPTPSLRPSAEPAARPQRTVATAQAAASPVAVESPAVATSATQDRPTAKPSSAALSKAQTGFVGQGRSQNADVAMEASSKNTAPVASAAARREQATQVEAGADLSPSAPARIAKAAAGADAPAATAQAQELESADIAGAQQPTLAAEAASAAVERSAANAPTGAVSASAGNVEVDTGPTQIVPEAGSGRASGGGQPTIAVNAQNQKLERSRPGGAAIAAIIADDVQPVAAAPAAEGGGAPTTPAGLEVADTTQKRAGGPPLNAAPTPLEINAGAAGAAGDVVASSIRRAANTDAPTGAAAGGGTNQPALGKGREIAMLTPSDAPTIEAAPHAGGAPSGAAVDAAGDLANAAASGLPGRTASGPVGASAGPTPVDAPTVGEVGTGSALVKATQGSAGAPVVGGAEQGAPLKKAGAVELPLGLEADAENVELATAPTGEAEVDADVPSGADLPGDLPLRASGSLPVRVAAEAGPGGLGLTFSAEVGLPDRRAQRQSEIVHQSPDKFLQKKFGGAAALAGTAKQIAEPFAHRGDRNDKSQTQGGAGKPTAKTEEAIELGLDFLARHQSSDGSWSFNNFSQGRPGYENERAAVQADTAATGLALLAFLGAGYDHYDDKYKERISSGLTFLLKNQRPDGDLYLPQDEYTNRVAQLYSHGIASIALCEAYGMTGDEELGKAAQKALDFIVAAQHEQRGGWRYSPNYMSDLSVSGWQLMAMRSGELAGLKVPKETYERVKKFVDRCQASPEDASRYVYNPYAANTPTQRHGRFPSTVMTSVGLLMRLYTGWNRENPDMQKGADHLLANLPQLGSLESPPQVGTISNPMRDTYYWYYATQVMFHMKGKYWEAWNAKLHPLLAESQIKTGDFAGSWDPRRPVPDKWGPHGGRIYLTAMNLLSLEVYYRHLPIYEETGK